MFTLTGFFLGIVFSLCVGYEIKRYQNKQNETLRKKYESKYGPICKSTQK